MTKSTAEFLLGLLNKQTISVGAPDFDDAVNAVLAARAELLAVLAADQAEQRP